jgi:signal transduction histidine kinase
MKILIVEDNPITRVLFERQIRAMGHDVIACETAETALESYQRTFYPLIILDLGLPGMDGFEFSRQIRSLPQAVRTMILVITAYEASEYLQTALEAGVDDFLTKPVQEDLLRARIKILEQQLQNLTKRRQAEDALKQAYKELKQTQQELIRTETLAVLGEFAAGLAHEIRNPLANIYSSAQYCMKKRRSEEQMQKHLNLILRNAERANRIIKNLLDFAKPYTLSFTLSNIGEILEKACNLTEAKRSEHYVQLKNNYSKGLPPIMLDETLIEQVFVNFILNALDAMKNGGDLSITAYAEGENIVVTFADTGEGIPPQELEKIFTPFYTTKPEGVGLGLSVTHRIVQSHKGKIDVESRVNEGTTVTVRLPISRE